MYHVDGDDLTSRLLDFSELHEKVPESRLCNDWVVGEDSHSVEFRGWIGFGWQMAADDLVFLEATCEQSVSNLVVS